MVKLRKWQEEFLAWAYLKHRSGQKSFYLAADVGTGKTIAALALAKKLKYEDIFVLAPLSAHRSWAVECEKLGINVDVWTYERFTRSDKLPITDFLILDEAHRVKNPSAKVTKRLLKYYLDTPKLLMSGTPQDKLWELYSQYKLIKPDIWNGLAYSNWVKQYFFLDSYFKPRALIKPEYKAEILRKVEPYTFRVRLEDVVEIPDVEVIDIDLPRSKKIDKVFKTWQSENLNPVTEFIAEYAIGQGIDPDTKEIFDTSKIDWVLDYVKDNPKTIVFSFFKAPIYYIYKKHMTEFYYITGENKDDLAYAVNKADKPVFATYALKEGANLQKYSTLVYLSLPLSYRDYYQSKGRVFRSGQEKKVIINHLYQQPIDTEVAHILANKKELNEYVRNRIYMRSN